MKSFLFLFCCLVFLNSYAGDSTQVRIPVLSMNPQSSFLSTASNNTFYQKTYSMRGVSSKESRGGFFGGALLGGAIGGGIGVVSGYMMPQYEPFRRSDQVLITGVTGAVTGALIGGLIGLLAK